MHGPDGRPAAEADRAAGAVFRLHRGLPALGPGSLRMALTALSNPLGHTPLQLLAGWVPAGLVSTESLKDLVRRAIPERWVDHPNYWAVACDYGSGRRTAFGRLDAPSAEIADAVAASCAIPGFYRPVKIGGAPLRGRRRLLGVEPRPARGARPRPRDLPQPPVVGVGPPPAASLDPRDWLGTASRQANGRRLAHEASKVRRFGAEVALVRRRPRTTP